MTAGTLQYTSENSTQATLGGSASNLTVTAATPKVYLVDPEGSTTLDLIAVAAASSDISSSAFEVLIVNQCTNSSSEVITLRDGNNSDALIGIVEEDHGTFCKWNGSRWVASSGAS